MKVIENPDSVESQEDVNDEVAFLLTNRMGSYIMMSHLPKSRFEGVFIRKNHSMFKVIVESLRQRF